MENPLDKYIEATRSKKEIIGGSDDSIYEALFLIIRHTFDVKDIEFKIVYSANATCEIVNLKGKSYLIYDKYFGHTLDILNRIYLRSKDPADFITYAFKLLAEKFQVCGNPIVGLCFATLYRDRIGKSKVLSNYRVEEKWLRNTAIQECYVILHELMHCRLRNSKKFESIILDTRNMLEGMLEEEEEYIIKQYSSREYAKIYEHLNRAIKYRDSLIEEIFCDDLATVNTINFMSELLNIKMIDTIENIHLVLRHLRFLAYLNVTTKISEKLMKEFTEGLDDLFINLYWDYESRFYFHRRLTAFRQSESDERLWEIISKNFINLNKNYAKISQWDKLLDEIYTRVKTIMDATKLPFYAPPVLSASDLNAKIDNYTKFII